jgi:hypothetical protein
MFSPMRPAGCTREFSADYNETIDAGTKHAIETKRKAFIRKWRLKGKAADRLEEAGGKLFTFTRFPKSQWKIDPHVDLEMYYPSLSSFIRPTAVAACGAALYGPAAAGGSLG